MRKALLRELSHSCATAANLAAARELGLNISAISDAAVSEADTIAERRARIETHGTPLDDLQVLKGDRWRNSRSTGFRAGGWCLTFRRT